MSENLKPRQSAVRILARVLADGQTVDDAILMEKDYVSYTDSDRQFIRMLILTTLRRLGQIDGVLARLLKRPLPRKQQTVQNILRLAVAQKLFLQTPDYAVVDTAVALSRKFHFDGMSGLVNGVLRHLMRLSDPLAGLSDPIINLPEWLWVSWEREYGSDTARKIAESLMNPPPLDITVAESPEKRAERWNGVCLPTGGVRVMETRPENLAGFREGRCWVQNAAASVPAQLFSDIKGKRVLDLCAAPGGKTAQLAVRSAQVTAVDISEKRMKRLKENMDRLGLSPQIRFCVADANSLSEMEPFDAVLLDAPCSATGTIARHPEIKYHRTSEDVLRLAAEQKSLLAKALELVRPGGEIVFSTCSLQPEEGDFVIESVLDRVTVLSPEDARWQPYRTAFGSLRFLPSQGMDGFYVCLMRKK